MTAVVARPTGQAAFNLANFLFKPGLAGGQDASGGIAAGEILDLRGASVLAAPDTGIIRANSPITSLYDTISNTTPAEPFVFRWGPTFNSGAGAYVGGFLTVAPQVTIATGTFIPATFSDTSNMMTAAVPGFSAFTFINELATIRNSGNFNLMSGLVMNVGLTHERNTTGTSTTAGATGISFSPQTRATVFGAVMTKTAQTSITLRPTFSTVSGSTVNLGTLVGLDCFAPAVALFQPQAGVENMTAYYGVRVPNITFGGASNVVNVINTALSSGTNRRVINATGTAVSTFGGHIYVTADSTGIVYGAAGFPFGDLFTYWDGSAYAVQFQATTERLLYSNPSADRFLFDTDGGNTVAEYNFNCARFSMGAQLGAVGNQVGNFVAPTRSVAIGGEWSDFLLTQAGNITVNAAMGLVAGWTVNAPSITIGTGSVTTAVALNVGGNPNQGTNRVGVRIISNPSGGGGVNAALWVTAGLSQFDGNVLVAAAGTNVGFYGTAPIAQQLAVPVTIAAVHAALVALGLIT